MSQLIIREFISNTLTNLYDIFGLVNKTLIGLYDMVGVVSNTSNLLYDINGDPSSSIVHTSGDITPGMLDTETNLFDITPTDPLHFSTYIDLSNMASGDTIIIRVYALDVNGAVYVLWDKKTILFNDIDSTNHAVIPYIPTSKYKVSIEQTDGTLRQYNWYRDEVDTDLFESSSSFTPPLPDIEYPLFQKTDGSYNYASWINCSNMTSGDTIVLRMYTYDDTVADYVLNQEKTITFNDLDQVPYIFIPFQTSKQYKVSIEQTSGTLRQYNWVFYKTL